MSVEELNLLHRRYVQLSQRFRAAWVFHQFVQSLAKVYLDELADRYPAEFQSLYAELKDISQGLNASEAGRLPARLTAVEERLDELVDALLAEDSRVDPAVLRLFFSRFRSYDEKILFQLIRFYLYSRSGTVWEPDRLDKIDFLVTRLGEEDQENAGQTVVRDRKHLLEVFTSLHEMVKAGGGTAAPADLEQQQARIAALRREMEAVEDLDDLYEHRVVPRYRELKHSLGDRFFEPSVLFEVLQTNVALKNTVRSLFRREERRIFTEHQQIFDLEREVAVDGKLDVELTRFRQDVEKFEQQLRHDDIRLDELAEIRQRVRSLIPRLSGMAGGAEAPAAQRSFGSAAATAMPAAVPAPEPAAEPVGEPVPMGAEGGDSDGDRDLIRDSYERLVGALEGTTLGAPPKAVTLTPDLFPFRLEPREVTAYRKLAFGVVGEKKRVDSDVERFLLRAAALRVRLAEQVEELRSLLDDTAGNPRAPIYDEARLTTRLADAFLARFHHLEGQAVLEDRADDARQLALLRTRLLRDYSELWLLTYKRQINEGTNRAS
jgi:hypothetical protein